MSEHIKIDKYGTVNIKSDNDMSRFEIQFYRSAITEVPGNRGISHLAEHLMCKSFMEDLEDEFTKYSIDYNAYTSTNVMAFHISGLDEYVEKYKLDILNRLLNYEISEEDFEKEKSIVLREYDNSFLNQSHYHILNLNRKYYNSYGAIGERGDIANITFEDFKKFKEERFTKPHRIINISKYNDFVMPEEYSYDDVKEEAIKYEFKEHEYIHQEGPDFGNSVSIINMTSPIEFDTMDIPKLDVLTDMYCNGLTSPLYKRIREEKGYVYGLGFAVSMLNNEQASIIFRTTTDSENVEDLNKEFFDIIEDASAITQQKLDDIKECYSIEMRIDDIKKGPISKCYVDGRKNTALHIEDITLDDLIETHKKYFNRVNFTLTTDREI